LGRAAETTEGDPVLRISSVTEATTSVTLKVEGALVGEWVPLLEAECLRRLNARKSVELDFSGLRFVDRRGVVMMLGLFAQGIHVVGANALVSALLGCEEPR
jgi:anti-anti-sigma regulatory factor